MLVDMKNLKFYLSLLPKGQKTPCFELWLLLHLKSLKDFSEQEYQLLIENKKITASKSSRTYIEKELLDLLGAYSKSNLQMNIFLPLITAAIERAYAAKLEEGWDYKRLCTRVHVLLTRILQLPIP
jgi:hypothetical protein